MVWQCIGKCLIEENEDTVNIYGCAKGTFLKLFIFFVVFYIDIQGSTFEDENLYEDFTICASQQIYKKTSIVCIILCLKSTETYGILSIFNLCWDARCTMMI